jgi:polar amino acid transport system substrate-binding protein
VHELAHGTSATVCKQLVRLGVKADVPTSGADRPIAPPQQSYAAYDAIAHCTKGQYLSGSFGCKTRGTSGRDDRPMSDSNISAMRSSRAVVARCCAAGAVAVLLISSALAQGESSTLRVATRMVPPMVEQRDQLTGFSIDLWNSIAQRLKIKSSYQIMPDVRGLLESVRTGEADLGVSAVSITAEREAIFEFSQPIMNAGLQILIRGSGESADSNPLADMLRLLFSRSILVWLGLAFLLILVPSHLIWVLERRHPNGILPSKKYFPGIFHAMFWAATTLLAQGDHTPQHWMARVVTVLWMFAAVVFVAFYTAQLTAALTAQKIQGFISGPEDLVGKRVGTTRESTSATYLRAHRAQLQEFTLIGEAYQAMHDKKVDAVVFDAPVLLYYAAHEGSGRVQPVGGVFHKEDYGIVFPAASPLRKQVNEALLAIREDGTYDQIYDRWFGKK